MYVELRQKKIDVFAVLVSWLSIISCPGVNSGAADVHKHLEMGRIHLENRQFSDALTHFHAAVEGDPENYQIYFKRALVFLALGKYNQALKDLDKVIELKSDFTPAVLQRANLLLKQGQLDKAHIDYENVLRKEPGNIDAMTGYGAVDAALRDLEEADYYVKMPDCHTALELLSRLIETCPWDPSLRRMRSECYMNLGDAQHAISDLRFTTKLVIDDTDGLYRLSSLLYQLGDVEESLREIRECLKLDPEHKHCFPLYKKLKKLDKSMQGANAAGEKEEYGECVADVKKALKVDSHTPPIVEWKLRHKLCWCHLKNGEGELAVEQCTIALKSREEADVLCDRAEAYLLNDLFAEAIEDYRRALDVDEDSRRARDGMQRAQKLQKQSKRRDYYKILGVKRSASKQEVIKAYRKAAQKWHPDNFQGDEKKQAEAKFIDIAAAKEVLTDPEKRAKFDQGEDPLDPEGQNQGHGHGFNPFTHFHFAGGSGPFHFKFQ
ncbi:unnamed protein product [Orchesella dallaii]|uniref:J domain-containing protein n=1 Tax=Orchesella dallaii TaxID=48710 RepID=A0ABP1R045_9HEXA